MEHFLSYELKITQMKTTNVNVYQEFQRKEQRSIYKSLEQYPMEVKNQISIRTSRVV